MRVGAQDRATQAQLDKFTRDKLIAEALNMPEGPERTKRLEELNKVYFRPDAMASFKNLSGGTSNSSAVKDFSKYDLESTK